jgi:hypothetical protein
MDIRRSSFHLSLSFVSIASIQFANKCVFSFNATNQVRHYLRPPLCGSFKAECFATRMSSNIASVSLPKRRSQLSLEDFTRW